MRSFAWASPLFVTVTASVWLGSADAPLAFHGVSEALALRATVPRDDEPRAAVLELRVHDAATGRPIPARVRIEGLWTTRTPNLGPEHRAAGALDTVVARHGRARVGLPGGRYRVRVTRGPEWSFVERTLELTDGTVKRVSAALTHVLDPAGYVAADFHLHAAPSPDSDVSLEDRVTALAAEGIGFAVPTDHNHVVDYAPVTRALGLDHELRTVPGVEVTTWEPDFGHFNAFPWTHDPSDPRGGAPRFRGRSADELFDELHAHSSDTVIQVNHPRLEGGIGYLDRMGFDPERGQSERPMSLGFDAIEVWNGFELERLDRLQRNLEDWMALLARGVRVTATGNSDSHRVHGQWAGYPRTYVSVEEGSGAAGERGVVRALRQGRAFVTSGPLLDASIDGMGPGDTVVVRGSRLTVAVRAETPAWMDLDRLEVYLGGERVLTERVTLRPRGAARVLEKTVDLPVRHGSFVVVLVRGDRPMDDLLAPRRTLPIAFTNPIWLE